MDIGLNIFKGVTRNFYSSNGDKINNLWRCEQQVRNKCIYITNKRRLNVLPINLQPLRDRLEDIPLLVAHFIKKLAAIQNKEITAISEGCLNRLMTYPWPGNIRELGHVIERSMLMTTGHVIKEVDLPKSGGACGLIVAKKPALKTLKQNERDYILTVLNECKWKIAGSGQAAEILGVPPSTLYSRMKKLGISKELN